MNLTKLRQLVDQSEEINKMLKEEIETLSGALIFAADWNIK